jgi:DNA repair ATPase RecN
LHSSDAHELQRLGATKLWIKADPTFAGLKQALNERERIFLGDEAPRYKSDHQVIDSISIPQSNGWFADDLSVDLNEGLVAIVGGRGSGKSALAEMLAAAVGASDDSPDAFVNKAAKHESSIANTEVTVVWRDGGQNSGLVLDPFASDAGLIKYLPQKAVESLCAPSNSGPLLRQIESVIFQALDETERRGASDFSELKQGLLSGFEIEKAQVAERIRELNAEFEQLSSKINSKPAKQRELELRKKELGALQAALPQLPKEDEKAQNELAGLIQTKKAFEEKVVALRKVQEQIAVLQTKVHMFQASFDAFLWRF